eukprot:TRINITY_DN23855_c0_g1_i1.p1 TRINITY_DN23855_c0_g1~~TRINITY_DN23855_c0_g1_i1.p1  ORF type:complete len:168 (-),score=32.54 TRINITY_DN23855_c0_g1_i1:228-683(-)
MGSIGNIEVEVELKSPADKFWGNIRESTQFPKIFPETYKSVEIVEGDGKSAGTITLFKYVQGVPLVTFSKEKIEAVDEVNKTLNYSVVDGELVNFYKNFKPTLKVSPKGDGSLVKWSVEFEKANAEVPDPHIIKDSLVKAFIDLDAYLLKA